MAVYFARAGQSGAVKIGYTAGDPEKRVRSLQTGTPQKLRVYAVIENAGPEVETELHRRFSKDRIGGEWFSLSDELMDFIREHREPKRGGRPEKDSVAKHLLLAKPTVDRAETVRQPKETFTALVETALELIVKHRTKAAARRRKRQSE